MRKARRLYWRSMLAVALSAGLFASSAYALLWGEAMYVCSGVGGTYYMRVTAGTVQSLAYQLAEKYFAAARSVYPEDFWGPMTAFSSMDGQTENWVFSYRVGGPGGAPATVVAECQRQDPDSGDGSMIVAAVNGATSQLQASNSWLSQVRSDTQTTAARLATISADVAVLKGGSTGQPVEVSFTSVGKYWLVCFITVMGLYLTALTAGDIIKMIRNFR